VTAYKTVFDATEAGWQTWPAVVPGLVIMAAGICLWFQKNAPRRFSVFIICFSALWTALAGWYTYGEYREVHRAIDEGRTKFAEGPVTHFVPMPKGGHAMESFCIAERCFTYSDYVVTTGFNNTAVKGGPITRNGIKARITYVGISHAVALRNIIVKVEVEDKDAAADKGKEGKK
jgi:hypothetical protein